jgi:hypothetical protein
MKIFRVVFIGGSFLYVLADTFLEAQHKALKEAPKRQVPNIEIQKIELFNNHPVL